MATAAHRGGSDPATTRKKGPKASGPKAGAALRASRQPGAGRPLRREFAASR